MPLEILGSGAARAKAPDFTTRFLVNDLLIRLRFQVLANPQSAGISTRFTCGEDVICSNAL